MILPNVFSSHYFERNGTERNETRGEEKSRDKKIAPDVNVKEDNDKSFSKDFSLAPVAFKKIDPNLFPVYSGER